MYIRNWHDVDEFDFTVLRMVVQKVANIKRQWQRSHDQHGFDERWVDWGVRLSYGAFVLWLAGDVADQLIHDCPNSQLDDLLLVADTAGSLRQDAAERFLQRFFVGYPVWGIIAYQRTIRVFRRVIKRKIIRVRSGIETERRSLV